MIKAVVIGCSEYDDPDIRALQFAHKDAEAFARALTDFCGVSENGIRLLTSPGHQAPTRANMARLLHELASSSPDVVFFFFSGHGFRSARDGRDYLLPQDAIFARLEYNSVPLDDVMAMASEANARCAVIVVDACRNVVRGGKSTGCEDLPPIDPTDLKVNGTAIFFSCQPSERSFEAPAISAGVFTQGLIDALGSAGRCRTVRELDAYLIRRVPELGLIHSRPIQTPLVRIEPLAMADVRLVSRQRMLELSAQPSLRHELRSPAPVLDKHLRDELATEILAIDFGSSCSLCGVPTRDGRVLLLPTADGRHHVPSAVYVLPNMDYYVGRRALRQAAGSEGTLLKNFKRAMATESSLAANGRDIDTSEIAAATIASILSDAEESLGYRINKVIAAVPASFSHTARERVGEAFIRTGVDLVGLISEPCAAAICGFEDARSRGNSKNDLKVLVIDIGGGTTDIAVVEIADVDGEIQIEVLAIHGSHAIGGQDFDEAIGRLIVDRSQEAATAYDVLLDEHAERELDAEAERVKIRLGTVADATVVLSNVESPEGLTDLAVIISRDDFVAVTESLVKQIEHCIQCAVREAGVKWDEIDTVMLAGQGSKIWPVQQLIRRMTAGKDLISKFQESAVVTGLAYHASTLSGNRRDLLLLDVLAAGLAVPCVEEQSDEVDDPFFPSRRRPACYLFSSDPGRNTQLATWVRIGTTIPTKHTGHLWLMEPATSCVIAIYETAIGCVPTELGSMTVSLDEDMRLLTLAIDVDALGWIYATVDAYDSNSKEIKILCRQRIYGRFRSGGKW